MLKFYIFIDEVDFSIDICGLKFVNLFGLVSVFLIISVVMIRWGFEVGWGFVVMKIFVFDKVIKDLCVFSYYLIVVGYIISVNVEKNRIWNWKCLVRIVGFVVDICF